MDLETATKGKKAELQLALERFHAEVERLKRDHEIEIQRILKEIDMAQMSTLKKQLGI